MKHLLFNKLSCIILLFALIFPTSCQQKQVAQTTVENSINQVQENQKENILPDETEPEKTEIGPKLFPEDIPFSSPGLNLSYKKNFIKTEEEYINGKNSYFFEPLQIRDNQFEYCIDQNLVRFDLKTRTEKVYEDFFQGLSITAPLYIPGEWIVADKNRYYYTENKYDEEILTKIVVCKDAETLKTIWKTKLFKAGNTCYINNKFMHDDKYLYVGFKENYKVFCIEMTTGKLARTFDPYVALPMLTPDLQNVSEAGKAAQSLYVKHVFRGGIVCEIHANIDKTKDPSNIFGNSVKKTFVISTNGKLINALNSEAIIFLDDQYLYQDGCKSLIDNKINWSGTVKFLEDEFMRFHKKNNVTINPYIYTSNNKMFYVQNNEVESKIIIFDNKTGTILWKKQYQDINLVTVIEMESKYYVFYKEKNNGFLLIHDIKSGKEKTIPITLNKEDPEFYMDYSTFRAGNQNHFLFSDSLLSFNEEKGLYQSIFSKKETEDHYLMSDFGNFDEPYYFFNQSYFVTAYNPIAKGRGVSHGGGFIVLEKK